MRKKSPKLRQLEKNRKSLLTNDLDTCFICGAEKQSIHEIYEGSSRINSMKYGCCIPLCNRCHFMIQNNIKLYMPLKELMCIEFMYYYDKSFEEFQKIFHVKHLEPIYKYKN